MKKTIIKDKKKLDFGKPRWDLFPFEDAEEIVKILTFGAIKYGPEQWKIVPDGENRYFAALIRHLVAYKKGEKADKETGFSHLSHAGCCLLFIHYYERMRRKNG
jgi:hypothetical protein